MNKFMLRLNKVCLSFSCILLLTGCNFLSNTNTPDKTNPEENEYYIVNQNYLSFSDYNVLEVIVSDSEKFILFDTRDDDSESGIGEWIKDGVSYPISFIDHDRNHRNGKHPNIVICPFLYHNDYWDDSIVSDMPPVIAMINNDQNNPGLYRWSEGAYPYNWTFEEEKIPVQYVTYTREDLHGDNYIPEKAAKFYSLKDSNTLFTLDELNLCFNGATGEGTWTLNESTIPIIAKFNQDYFSFYVYYNTDDERDGVLIFSGEGISVNDITDEQAVFTLSNYPKHCNFETLSSITIKKTNE